ncbi:hypothetical protein BJ165DRAFT_262484 [Panaeolus papilionaceus]|nr:hypothetical protein BJ165DRAFT_262484 [Panaeolus papilionaceus]
MSGTENQENLATKCIKNASLKPVDGVQVDNSKDLLILIMGPTGAGKSAFIEALSGSNSLGISRDQLDSYTQDIATYELNITWEDPGTDASSTEPDNRSERVYILDSPGFSDSELSELEIITMVNKWMKAHRCEYIDCILYLCPITDTRLPGSKRRTMKMVKRLSGFGEGLEEPGTMMVVTTMWNRIWNERTKMAAEERFAQLRDDIWKDLVDAGGVITRFLNTHESALEVINTLCVKVIEEGALVEAYYMVEPGRQMHDAPYVDQLYQELLDRIQNAQVQIQSLDTELTQPETQASEELVADVEERLGKISRLLTKDAIIKKHPALRIKTSDVLISKVKRLFRRGIQAIKLAANRSRLLRNRTH